MISYIKGGMQAKDIWKKETEANIRAPEGCEWGVKNLYSEKLLILHRSFIIIWRLSLED
jgi:hypothetical protein